MLTRVKNLSFRKSAALGLSSREIIEQKGILYRTRPAMEIFANAVEHPCSSKVMPRSHLCNLTAICPHAVTLSASSLDWCRHRCGSQGETSRRVRNELLRLENRPHIEQIMICRKQLIKEDSRIHWCKNTKYVTVSSGNTKCNVRANRCGRRMAL